VTILIGSAGGDHVQVNVSGWAVDEPENPVDAAWLATEIGVVAGPFQGRVTTQLRRDDLVSWRDEFAALDREVRAGQARFSATLEHSVGLVVSVSGVGSLSVEGWVEPSLGKSAEQRLEFRFPIDQSVRQLLAQLDSLLHQFPESRIRA
jgi:hypothetical protein